MQAIPSDPIHLGARVTVRCVALSRYRFNTFDGRVYVLKDARVESGASPALEFTSLTLRFLPQTAGSDDALPAVTEGSGVSILRTGTNKQQRHVCAGGAGVLRHQGQVYTFDAIALRCRLVKVTGRAVNLSVT